MDRTERQRSRRALLQRGSAIAGWLAASALLPRPAQAHPRDPFAATSLAAVVEALGGKTPPQASPDVMLDAPASVEDGTDVPLAGGTTLAAVHSLLLVAPGNPTALVAAFHPDAALATDFSLSAKLDQSGPVYAVALMADGSARFAHQYIEVALGACSGPLPADTGAPDAIRIRARLMAGRALVSALINHPMESGRRLDPQGQPIPAHYIETVQVRHNDRAILRADWGPWVARHPILRFSVPGARSGDTIELSWQDSRGESRTARARLA